MTITRVVEHRLALRALLIGAWVLAPVGVTSAWQAGTPPASRPAPPVVILSPAPSVQFQQTVQQQQLSDQLQKNQLEQQLHQGVTDNAKRPLAGNAAIQPQLDQADRAQQDRERARQQALLQREQNSAPLPPPPLAIPTERPAAAPATARSGG